MYLDDFNGFRISKFSDDFLVPYDNTNPLQTSNIFNKDFIKQENYEDYNNLNNFLDIQDFNTNINIKNELIQDSISFDGEEKVKIKTEQLNTDNNLNIDNNYKIKNEANNRIDLLEKLKNAKKDIILNKENKNRVFKTFHNNNLITKMKSNKISYNIVTKNQKETILTDLKKLTTDYSTQKS